MGDYKYLLNAQVYAKIASASVNTQIHVCMSLKVLIQHNKQVEANFCARESLMPTELR